MTTFTKHFRASILRMFFERPFIIISFSCRHRLQFRFPFLPAGICLTMAHLITNCRFSSLVRSPKDGELLGLEWGIIRQVSNTIFPDPNSCVRCQYSKGSDTMRCLT